MLSRSTVAGGALLASLMFFHVPVGPSLVIAGHAQRPPSQVPLTLEEIGILATFGLREQDGPSALLQKPLDAALVADGVLVLDASPPWVRLFDREGRLMRAVSGRGEGPGEAMRPVSLAPTGDGGFLLSHTRGIERFGPDGRMAASIRGQIRPLGAVELCDGGVVALLEQGGLPDPVSAAVRLGPAGAVGERLLTFDDARGSVRNYHPWFVDTYEGRALFYAEEERRHRLIELGCDGRVVRELALDSLGRGQVFQRTERGFRLTSPGYPFPAGLARVENRVLWATRVLEPAAGGALDSLTVITAWGSDGGPRRVTIRGWYQLFDGAPDGSLLFGNSWTLGQNWAYAGTWGLIPAVFLVDGNALLRILDEAPPPVTPPAR